MGTILVDSDGAEKSISKTGDKADGMASKLGKGIATAGKWALGIGVAAAGVATAAFAMTKKVTEGFDVIAKTSRKMGVTTDFYQEMDYWASQNGLSQNDMEKSMQRLNQRLGEAANGNKKYSAALTELGVDMEAVKAGTVSTEEAMTQSIQALSQMENGQQKAALAAELFGTKLAQEMMPALDAGALSIEDAQAKAKELGIVIGEDTLNAAEAFNDSWDDITRSLTAVGQKLLAELMPAFQAMMDWVLAHMPQIQAVFNAVFDAIAFVFTTFKAGVQAVIDFVTRWKEDNADKLKGIENDFLTKLKAIWEFLKTTFDNIKKIVTLVMEEVAKFIKTQLDAIQKFWQENGDTIMKAVENAFNFIKGVIEFIMPIVTNIIKVAWNLIKQAFDSAIGIIMGLVQVFSGLLTGDFGKMKEGLVKIWQSLWDLIKGIVAGAWDLLSGVFGTLWTSISGWFEGLKEDAIQWGKNMILGFIDGITSMISKVKDTVGNVMSAVGDFLGFNSPAKKGEGRNIVKWGRNMVDGFLDGVNQESKRIGGIMNHVIGTMPAVAMGTVTGAPSSVKSSTVIASGGGTTYTGNIYVTIDGKDFENMRDVTDFFNNLSVAIKAN